VKAAREFTDGKSIVQVVMPHAWIGRINRLAQERGVNRSALIREAIASTYFDLGAEGGNGGERAEANGTQQPAD